MDGIPKELKGFLDAEGRMRIRPSKCRKRVYALYYLASKFEAGKQYSEKKVNALLIVWTLWGDPATLRRELYDHHLLDRTADGKLYRLEEDPPTVETLLKKYG